MVFIKVNPSSNKVTYANYKPFDEKYGLGKTQEQLEQEGILVDSILEPEQIEGKVPILYCNPETKELWYEYEDIPKTPEQLQAEEIENLKVQLVTTQQAVDFLLLTQTI